MKKAIIQLIVIAFLIITIISGIYQIRKYRYRKPWDTSFNFISPYLVKIDSKNNLILVDNRSKRLSKITPKGEVIFSLDGGKRGKNEFYLIWDIALDSKDNIYIINIVVSLEDGYAGIYEIQRYTPDGKYDKTIIRYERTKEERMERDNYILGNMQIEGDYIYYLLYKKKVGSTIYKININGKEPEKVVTIPGKLQFINMVGTKPGSIFITKFDGKIYQIGKHGELVPIKLNQDLNNELITAPWGLEKDEEGNLYVSDVDKQNISKILNNGNIEIFIDKTSLKQNGYDVQNIVLRYFNLNNNKIAVVDEYNSTILVFNKDGNLDFSLKNGYLSLNISIMSWLFWIGLFVAIILIGAFIVLFYLKIMNRRAPVVLKQLLVFIPVIAGSIAIVSYQTYAPLYQKQLGQLFDQVAMIAQIAKDKIDGDALERITKPEHFNNADYKKVQDQMHQIMNDNADPWNALPYSRIYKYKGGLCYITVDWSGYYGVTYPFTFDQKVHKEAYEKGTIGFTRYSDFDSDLIVGVAPIRNSKGNIVGVYEVIIDAYILDEVQKIFVRNLIQGISLSLLVFIIAFSIFTFILMNNLTKLRNALMEVSSGKFDTTITIKSRDEIGDLGKGFNIMAGYIRDYIKEITDLNEANSRFVPTEFLKFLNKKSIIDIKLGDQVQKVMTVLFSDIRSFTSLSETMTPEENFNFINAYLRRVGPVIRDNHGFIDKYIGDAIMALFDEKPEHAVMAGIQMKRKLEEYNKQREKKGYKTISIGVGIHTGSLMLGIVGEEKRFDGTVISDNVNLASRLEGLTKMYGAGIIISENTLKGLDNIDKYYYRFLDKVKVKGKTAPVSIYEILNGETPETIELKLKTRDMFENALIKYQEGKLLEAKEIFNEILKINDHDKACNLFIKRCDHYLKLGLPENWEGVEALDEK